MLMNNDLLSFSYIILVSVLCGFILGLEREIHNKPAGLKTVTLVVLGSAMFTFASINGFNVGNNVNDTSRVASQIVNGIGFLGAGVILRSELKIIGLTTAATLWVSAAIGMLIGLGLMSHAIISTLMIFILINFLRIFESKIVSKYMHFELKIFPKNEEEIIIIKEMIESYQIKLESFNIEKIEDKTVIKIRIFSDINLFFDSFIKELKKKNIKYSL